MRNGEESVPEFNFIISYDYEKRKNNTIVQDGIVKNKLVNQFVFC
jgi:hypothetical protein